METVCHGHNFVCFQPTSIITYYYGITLSSTDKILIQSVRSISEVEEFQNKNLIQGHYNQLTDVQTYQFCPS